MEITDLTAQVRREQKKGPARRLRQQGFVPAIFYGANTDNIQLAVKSSDLFKLHKEKKDHAFIKLIIDDGGKKIEKLSLIKELQVQPLTGKLYHADFYEVDMKKKLSFEVDLNFVGNVLVLKTEVSCSTSSGRLEFCVSPPIFRITLMWTLQILAWDIPSRCVT